MRLSQKAVGAGAVLVAIVLAGGLYTVLSADDSIQVLHRYEQRAAALQRTVAAMRSDFYNYDDQNNMYVLVAAAEPDQVQLWQDTYAQAQKAADGLNRDLAAAQALADDDTVRTLLAQVQRDKSGYDGFFDQGHQLVVAGRTGQAAHVETIGNLEPSNDMMPTLDKLSARADQAADASLTALQTAQNGVRDAAIVAMAATVLLTALLIFGFLRTVLRPLRLLGARMAQIAHGDVDLNVRIGWTRTDEIGHLAGSFDKFVDRMSGIIANVADTAVTLTASATQLAELNNTVAGSAVQASSNAETSRDRAAHTAREVETLAAASEEMGAAIAEVSRNATAAAMITSTAVTAATATGASVAQLAESSQQIGDVVKTITAIAAQTNLLALNATIEAARAGAAGKGFAVVAGEVKDLAQETARATEDIARRIETIRADTRKATDAITEIGQIIAEINTYQTAIAAAVEEQAATVNEMNRGISRTATGSGAIADAAATVAEATHITTTNVDRSQALADQLTHLATDLDLLVSPFRQ